MTKYTAITFSPVQGFIEQSRKLRDLYGASLILSHLSKQLITDLIDHHHELVISPGITNVTQGTPNRIVIKKEFSHEDIKTKFILIWQKILNECKKAIYDKEISRADSQKLKEYSYTWNKKWNRWKCHAWEIFSGRGDSIETAIADLEAHKLKRNWTGINWVGESSSITGTDDIAWYGLGSSQIKPNQDVSKEIKEFYQELSRVFNEYIDENERLSIPQLVKRLVTIPRVAEKIKFELLPELKDPTFKDFIRRAKDNKYGDGGQWTGWFMGDGDKVGDYIISLGGDDEKMKDFTHQMSKWGQQFQKEFNEREIGRVVYAGGDDFLGVIYNKTFGQDNQPENQKSISFSQVYHWLKQLPEQWEKGKSPEINEKITLSVGFIWAGHSVPQRDILQHCRAAEQISKEKGRNSITIRILFNNGQYTQWTTPWKYLDLLDYYKDREGGKNWRHIYSDLAQLKSRHAFGLAYGNNEDQKQLLDGNIILENRDAILNFFDLYFAPYKNKIQTEVKNFLEEEEREIFKYIKDGDDKYYGWELIHWLEDLITVGFYLFKDAD